MLRYSLLPYWYSVFFEAFVTGVPVMRPLFVEFPEREEVFAMDDEWFIGASLLVKPVTDAGANSVDVYFPPVQDTCDQSVLPWYDLETLQPVSAPALVHRVQADLSKIPVFIKPGKIS